MADLKNYKCYKNGRFQVLTQDGFKDFKGLLVGENENKIKITFANKDYLICTPKHKLLTEVEEVVYAKDLTIGSKLYGGIEVTKVDTYKDKRKVYELLEVEDTHTYYANGVLSHQCLVIDEMAFIESHLVDEFWKSVFPIITSSKKSKVFVCSTANGTDNLFYKLYIGAVEGTNSWTHDKIKWDEIPGRDEAWAKDTKTALGSADAWLQEFECEFIHSGESTLDDELFEEMMQKVSKPKITLDEGHYKIWEEPDDTKLYVAGVDISEGVGVDASVIQILDITNIRDIKQVAIYRNNKIPPLEFTNKLYKILRNWGSPLALIERNNCGAQVVDRLAVDLGYEKIVSYGNANAHRRNVMRGMIAHTNTKYKGVLNMRYFMNEVRTVSINEEETVMELRNFVRYSNGTWKARAGFHDDRVMAMLYSLFILEKEITERFFEIVEEDDMGKPLVIEPMDFGLEYFEDSTSIYLDEEIVGGHSHTIPVVVWGMGEEVDAEMDELKSFGYHLIGEKPPEDWQGKPMRPV